MNGVISNFIINKIQINDFELTPQHVTEIQIFEGLTIPAITGKMYIADREALLELHEVFAGDVVEFQFVSKADRTETFKYRGVISSAGGSVSHDHTFPVTIFEFCDEWWFNAITMQVSRAYKNVIWEEIVDDLITICGGNFVWPNHASTNRIERYVTPYWTPAHTIKEVLSWASVKAHNNFILHRNLILDTHVYCETLDDFIVGIRGVHKSDLLMGSPNIHYEGNLNTVYLESYYDSLRHINQGVYKTDFVAFDYDHSTVYKSSNSVENIDRYHLAAHMPMNKAHTSDNYTSQSIVNPYFNQQKRQTVKEIRNRVDNLRDINYGNLFTDMIKFNMMAPGASDRMAGQLAMLRFPSINSKSEQEMVKHKALEGLYLIRNICHIIKPNSYNQALTLVRDGFETMDRTDLVQWKKKTTLDGDV